MTVDGEMIGDDALRSVILDEEAGGEVDGEDRDQRRRRRSLLVWLLLVLLLLIISCLVWRYSDIGRAPDQRDTAGKPAENTAAVPDVTGMSKDDAVRVLEEAGFDVQVDVSFDSAADPDTVVGQDPPGGSTARIGSTIFITVTEDLSPGERAAASRQQSGELVDVPDVVGWTRTNATDELRAAGFAVTVTGVYSNSVPAGIVISQSPGGDSSALEGSTITLLVSLGTQPVNTVPVPRLLGLTAAQASARVRAAGLEPRLMYQPKPDMLGKVYEQSPAPGTEVPEDRFIFLLIGAEPKPLPTD